MTATEKTPAEALAESTGRAATPPGRANRLREHRKRLGLTLADVSPHVGVTLGYLSQLERGHNVPSLERAFTLAEFYGTTVDELWRKTAEGGGA